jgi:PKHD-type hydroxylase
MILSSYIWFAPSYFSPKECDEIDRAALTLPVHEGRIGKDDRDADSPTEEGGNRDDSIRTSTIKWFSPTDGDLPANIIQKLFDVTCQANDETGWQHNFDYKENTQYTVYHADNEKPKGDFYTWHTDAGPEVNPDGSMRKLSMTVQLSDPDDYEGGHFQWLEPQRQFDKMEINTGKPTIDIEQCICTAPFSAKERGSVIIFPSFLYHQVTPLSRGIRKVLVNWYCGKPYV